MRRIGNALLLVAALAGSAGAAPQVTAIRHWTAPDHTRIVLDLSASGAWRASTRDGPERIVIDIPGGGFDCATGPLAVGDALVQRVRCNTLRQGAQVVLDLEDGYRYRAFALAAIPGTKPVRVVVDVFPERRDGGASATPSNAGTGTTPAAERAASPAPAAAASPFGREVVIVVDPGHGGEDPGAVRDRLREKDITLDVARRLERSLESRPGFRVVLTRSGDYTVGLAKRRDLAASAAGDAFISIHCNTGPRRSARGVELFYLSPRGASSRRVQALADLENAADLVGGVHPAADAEAVRLVYDERLAKVMQRSYRMALRMHSRTRHLTGLPSRGIKRAAFAVCKTVAMPAVLVEVGFLTNPLDREVLATPAGRQKLADWLAESLDAYFHKYRRTLDDPLFSTRDKLVYRVRRGDNLTLIARRYGISVEDLVSANDLQRADRLAVGQRLVVVADATPAPREHTVRRGETLSGIAQRYGLETADLARLNDIRRHNRLLVGQTLRLRPEAPQRIEHVVRRGETLSEIAQRYGLSVRDLASDNGLSRPDRLRVGQRLVVTPRGTGEGG
ncbi:MAG: N-acetylmuramoyl-L-alanine amidase [Candidatus Krumholzibacteriota bacterium]|nr:N-acetylmuramoyl-L-alanine amidase [Candidatus Krumholzibacteriota bacterium]